MEYVKALRLVSLSNLSQIGWRHHGLGMLQGEINETQRVHIWDPELRTIPLEGYRDVHDHRFDLTSTVLLGQLWDVRYDVRPAFAYEGDTDAWQIKHAKIQDPTEFNTRLERPDSIARKVMLAIRAISEKTHFWRNAK